VRSLLDYDRRVTRRRLGLAHLLREITVTVLDCVDAISTDASIKNMDRDYIDPLEDPAEKSLFGMMRAGAHHLDSVSKAGGIEYQPYR